MPDDFQKRGPEKKNGEGILPDLCVECVEELMNNIEREAKIAGKA